MSFTRFLRIALHPFLMGMVLTMALILFTPPWFSRYKLKKITTDYQTGENYCLFEDLNADGTSEKILVDLNNQHLPKFQIFNGDRIFNSFKIAQAVSGSVFLWTEDLNADSLKELIILSASNDSVFLNVINSYSEKPYLVKDRFIARQNPGIENEIPDPGIVGYYDYDNDKIRELIFHVNTGYRGQPRNVYLFNLVTDSLIVSPKSGASVKQPFLFDLSGDSIPEVVYGSFAPGNLDASFPYTDQKAWLMALDSKLNFVFKPVPFEKYPCRLSVIPFNGNSKQLLVLKHYSGDDSISSTIGLYSAAGECIIQQDLHHVTDQIDILPGGKDFFYLLDDRISIVSISSFKFDTIGSLPKPGLVVNSPEAILDADGDGKNEYIFKASLSGLFYIAASDLTSFTPVDLKREREPRIYYSIQKSKNRQPLVYFTVRGQGTGFTYSVNPFFRFRYLSYIAAYFGITLFLYILYLIQQYRARMQYETSRRMNELQLRAVKNQMDPHFTFNILNSIGSLYSDSENRTKADYLFGKYARLLRQTIVSSDQPEITLEQELEFIRNYLDIEKFRMNNDFSYSVEIDSDVDTSISVPRMLIHTFVENAVKYAIRQVEGQARLDIKGFKSGGRLQIEITDNGPGLNTPLRTQVAGTGKGLAMVDEMIRLYFDMKGIRISYTIEEVIESGKCAGTRVNVLI